jgi:hypothetical protein
MGRREQHVMENVGGYHFAPAPTTMQIFDP